MVYYNYIMNRINAPSVPFGVNLSSKDIAVQVYIFLHNLHSASSQDSLN